MTDTQNKYAPAENKQDKTSSSDVKYLKIDNTTYEVVSNYVGKYSLLDIVILPFGNICQRLSRFQNMVNINV